MSPRVHASAPRANAVSSEHADRLTSFTFHSPSSSPGTICPTFHCPLILVAKSDLTPQYCPDFQLPLLAMPAIFPIFCPWPKCLQQAHVVYPTHPAHHPLNLPARPLSTPFQALLNIHPFIYRSGSSCFSALFVHGLAPDKFMNEKAILVVAPNVFVLLYNINPIYLHLPRHWGQYQPSGFPTGFGTSLAPVMKTHGQHVCDSRSCIFTQVWPQNPWRRYRSNLETSLR